MGVYIINIKIPTLPETNVEPLKINGLEDEFQFEKNLPIGTVINILV